MNRRTLAGVILALILSFGLVGSTLAHAKLVSSEPKDDAKLDTPPAKITLVFSEELGAEKSSFTVTNTTGTQVGEGKLDLNDLDRKTLSGTMDQNVAAGVYTITWTAFTADDNNTEEGTISFTIGADQAQPTATVRPTTVTQPTAARPTTSAQPTTAAQPTAVPSNLPQTGDGIGHTTGWLFGAGAIVLLIGTLILRRMDVRGRH